MKLPKRIRLGLPQKPHGRPAQRLFSWQQEWLEARNAEFVEQSYAAHREKMTALKAKPVASLLDAMERSLEMAEASALFHLNTSLFYGVDMGEMPLNPPTGDGKG